jgi:hypothetical protein
MRVGDPMLRRGLKTELRQVFADAREMQGGIRRENQIERAQQKIDKLEAEIFALLAELEARRK